MKKIIAGILLSAAMVAGTAVETAPAQAAGIYVSVGNGHHHHWRHNRHWRGYYYHNRYWQHRYHCRHTGWCYR